MGMRVRTERTRHPRGCALNLSRHPPLLFNSKVPINAIKHHEANSPTPGLLIKCVCAPAAQAARRAAYATRYDRVNPGSELRWLVNMISILFFFFMWRASWHHVQTMFPNTRHRVQVMVWRCVQAKPELSTCRVYLFWLSYSQSNYKRCRSEPDVHKSTRMTAPVPQSCKQPHLTSRWGGLETVLSADVDQQRCANAHPELKVHKSDKHPIENPPSSAKITFKKCAFWATFSRFFSPEPTGKTSPVCSAVFAHSYHTHLHC